MLPLFASVLALAALSSAPPGAPNDGAALRTHLQACYPSLAYVERYRSAFPEEVQGDARLWQGADVPTLASTSALIEALVSLQDQHVSLAGPKAGKSETLGIVLRTSSDNQLVVWRLTDPSVTELIRGDAVVAVNGQPAAAWLNNAAAKTFGGNRRSRVAEAALDLGLGTPIMHSNAGLGASVQLTVHRDGQPDHVVDLPYPPMTGDRAAALATALDSSDLPPRITVDGLRVATLRIGAFAPQFDRDFEAAAAAEEKREKKTASRSAAASGDASDDGPMLAGFCAVVGKMIAKVDANTLTADALLIDLRGNFGGYDREARLMARALMAQTLPRSFDVFPSRTHGQLKLIEQPEDASCGTIKAPLPLIVWTDAGTRSSGELMTAWLWGAGAVVAGERTIGAGGGLDADAEGFALPRSGLQVRSSGNFTFFDLSNSLRNGDTNEAALIDTVAADQFAPSRTRPFAIQAAGVRPDVSLISDAADLQEGGLAAARKMLTELARRGILVRNQKVRK